MREGIVDFVGVHGRFEFGVIGGILSYWHNLTVSSKWMQT